MQKSNLTKILLLVVSSIIFFFILLEIVLRIINPFEVQLRLYKYSGISLPPSVKKMDSQTGWLYKENVQCNFSSKEFNTTVTTNNYGFRDEDFALEKKDHVKRIVVLGDSFTFGWGVEQNERFTEVVEKGFNNSVELYNFGVSGYSTLQELILFKRALKFKPDIALLTFYDNDVGDNFISFNRPSLSKKNNAYLIDYSGINEVSFMSFIHADKAYLETGTKFYAMRTVKEIKTFFRKNSYAYNLISGRIKSFKRTIKESKGNKKINAEIYLFKEWLRICKEHNILPFIAIIPNKLEIQPEMIRANKGKEYDNVFRRAVVKFCEEEKIPYLDVTSLLTPQEKEKYHFSLDEHLTPLGHKSFGTHLVKALTPLLNQ
ncbi:MAG: SGNH/GDSL hydrolase family protein [Nitrospinae bacterium]|nr:SGNH/GDSL hydrolase family protein [Nitrospinota bacterium]